MSVKSTMPGSVLQMARITVKIIVCAMVQYNEETILNSAAALSVPKLVIVSQLKRKP